MRYLALGDSMSIDVYTGVRDGGAASQLARLLPASGFTSQAADGATTTDVLQGLGDIRVYPDIVTLTAGGNDLLLEILEGREVTDPLARAVLGRIDAIVRCFDWCHATIVVNTVYDPTDGNDARFAELRLPVDSRAALTALNEGIRAFGTTPFENRVLVADLEALFRGHGPWSADPWIVQMIEPNHAGATAIAAEWHRLIRSRPA